MKVPFILLIFFQIYSVKSYYHEYTYLYEIKEIDIMKKGEEYSFEVSGLRYSTNLVMRIYLNEQDSSVSNPFSFSYELRSYYDGETKTGQLEAETTTEKDHYIIYTTYSYKYDEKFSYLTFKVTPNMDIGKVAVIFLDNSLLGINTANIVFFVFAGLCVLLCVISLILTKACGSKNASDSQMPNSPIQPEIQIAQNSEQSQPLI